MKSKRAFGSWPFWLLIAAWFCANSPQAATFKAIVWLGEARHFSHQQRLTLELASVLDGGHTPAAAAVTKTLPARPALPAIPAEVTLKKIDLAIILSSEVLPRPDRVFAGRSRAAALPVSPWSEPPSEPPRGV